MTSKSHKIALRVAQRNAWSTYSPKKVTDLFRIIGENRDDLLNQSKIPSAEWLDKNFPIREMRWDLLRYPKSQYDIQTTWIGHASVLFQMGSFNIISDPIFSDRCSAFQWIGPKRYRRPACTIEEMMIQNNIGIDTVLISHNHYDHLDFESVKQLADFALLTDKPIQFVVPLGLQQWFERNVPNCFCGGNKVTELDWHESITVSREENEIAKKIRITSVPMQHWSNRYGFDKDQSLWCGFTVELIQDGNNEMNTRSKKTPKFLFSGDTGWFDEAHDIGSRYGPFDVAAIPIGAYEPRWFMKQEHMNPDDAVRFMDAVQTRTAIPIHWGTFPL